MPQLITIDPEPGLRGAGTEYQAKNMWYLSDCVRGFLDWIGPIGGWTVRTASTMTGKVRAGIAWLDLTSIRWQAWGSEQKLYVLSQTATTPSDVTPAGLVTGHADAASGSGYGVGPYGVSTYGTPRVDTGSVVEASMWTFAIWPATGDLLACLADDGRIFRWQLNTGVAAAALGGTAPTANQAVAVSPEGFVFALGDNADQRAVAWSDQGSLTSFTPTSTNQAGSLELQSEGTIKCGVGLRTQTVVWTTADLHAFTYVGLPAVYRVDRVGEQCGIISRGAYATEGSFCYWMSMNGFFVYDGGSVRKIRCEIWDDVFSDINLTQRSKITMQLNSAFNEFIVRWCSKASTEIDRCASYNYEEDTWWLHPSMIRLCGIDANPFQNPIMASSDGYLYDHETGYVYGGATPYIMTGPLELGEGDRLTKVLELIPDEKTRGDVTLYIYGKDTPNGSETTFGPFTMADFTDIRVETRQAKFKWLFGANTNSRLGNWRLNTMPGARR